MAEEFSTAARGICATGGEHVTEQLQALIDEACAAGLPAVISPGTYLTAPLFVPSGAHVVLEKDAVLLGTTDESRIPRVDTRAAGIECPWYPGVLNVSDARDVVVEGEGAIDGQGPYWWGKYWGADQRGGMRAGYDARGVRWACDYDCLRPRNLVVMRSSHVTVRGITSRRSGFWNVHVCYSDDVLVERVTIEGCGETSPSTDGIDIDSSHHVTVRGCVTDCNDDSICIKSGRDADGMRVGRPCHHVTVEDCRINAGFGVTIGSEVSGGVHDIVLRNLVYTGTDCGFRIKSSEPRKGYIKNIVAENLDMTDVRYPVHVCLNWNPGYSLCYLPEGYEGEVPPLWRKLLDKSQMSEPNTLVENVALRHVRARLSPGFEGSSRALNIEGFADQPIRGFVLEDAEIEATEFGCVSYVENFGFRDAKITVRGENDAENDDYDNR